MVEPHTDSGPIDVRTEDDKELILQVFEQLRGVQRHQNTLQTLEGRQSLNLCKGCCYVCLLEDRVCARFIWEGAKRLGDVASLRE